MKTKRCNLSLILYELRNLAGNPFTAFFGIVFPFLMLLIITNSMIKDVPKSMLPEINTTIFISISMIIPMAIVLLGHSANYSQELEKEIPERMRLFGFPERSIMMAKAIAQAVALTIGLFIYTIFSYMMLDLEIPSLPSALCMILCQYALGALFFALAHGISGIFKKFGPTYAVVMIMYFAMMILCGMMGVKTSELPEALQYIAGLLPMSYISSDFIEFWQGGTYNFGPMIQAFVFMGAVSGLLLLLANYKNRRVTVR